MRAVNPARRRGRPRTDRTKTDECDYKVTADPEVMERLLEEQEPMSRFISALEGLDLTFTFSDGHERNQKVRIVVTKQRCGVRHWWACPRCGKRVRDLYAPTKEDFLACRACHGLVYRRQYWRLGPAEWLLFRFIVEGPVVFLPKPKKRRRRKPKSHQSARATPPCDATAEARPFQRPEERVDEPEVGSE